ncbi:MAG TPA: ChaN family lipoprotein [Longimicrobiales bacterium]|nr:ChaN family lipoprotein [Longimicrobiales bacterium]
MSRRSPPGTRRRCTAGRASLCLVALPALLVAPVTLEGQDPDPLGNGPREGSEFKVYDRDGGVSSFGAILDAATGTEVLLIGEEHDDAIGHALELGVLVGAWERLSDVAETRQRHLVLSLEMFEQDVQYVLDEYLAGLISEEHFVSSARAWESYGASHRPLVEFAKAHGVPVLAANAPRRYVNRVASLGPEALLSLSPLARSFLPPLPYPGPSERYRAEWERVMSQGAQTDSADAHGHVLNPYAIDAQALWDASMAYVIAGALMRDLGALVVHVAGSFHVSRETGIPERIADYRPGTRVTSLVIAKAEDVDAWSESDHSGLADFVVLTATRARG